jgi:threonine/homoserine/homoserine lactone efflux protein
MSNFRVELREKAGFVGLIAVTNPVILTAYVMFLHPEGPSMQFWIIGMVLTAATCLIALAMMALIVRSDRRQRQRRVNRNDQWEDLLPYDPRKADRRRGG